MTGKLTHKDVQEIFAIIDNSEFDELHLETEGLKLTLRRHGAPAVAVAAPVAAATSVPAGAAAIATGAPIVAMQPAIVAASAAGLVEVPAPMLGVFYRAPKPGADPYVTSGSKVAPDTIIGIIEVMKLMNPVAAGVSGVVADVVAPDGVMVEFGQPILRVKPE